MNEGASTAQPNRLAASTSPYLRQHAENPVDWYEWGPEALGRAERENRPILLSVGYSACHWCHVMAHESFEDEATAALMNAAFVNIKVDREERPDIDAIYQKVVQLMGQGGGWPLTVFLTPQGKPFYGGTYFPVRSSYGRPSFTQVLTALRDLWREDPAKIQQQVESFMQGFELLAAMADEEGQDGPPLHDAGTLRRAGEELVGRIDDDWGGFGREPKFPNPTSLEILAVLARDDADNRVRDEAEVGLRLTLDRMDQGGIHDQLRGGFARYSVDRVWLVPHFEKMLYDNAQLLPLYAEAAARWPDAPHYQRVARAIVEYLVADMRDDQGTFYAATDADSEGEEGKYFCWTPSEVTEVVGDPELAKLFCRVYGVTERGNFEHGWSILHLPRTLADFAQDLELSEDDLLARLEPARAKLLAHRYRRVPPLRDEKVLTSWNALLVSGLARASTAAATWDTTFAERARELAVAAATRLCDAHVKDGLVYRAAFEGRVHTRGILEDVAFLARACLDLHELTLDPSWRDHAASLARHALDRYARAQGDGFCLTASDAEQLIERTESQHDGPIPSGLGVMVEVLLRLDAGDARIDGARAVVDAILRRYRGAAAQPFAYASLLTAAAHAAPHARHVTLRGPSPEDPRVVALASAVRAARLRLPNAIALEYAKAEAVTAIVCEGGGVCRAPEHDIAAVLASLRAD